MQITKISTSILRNRFFLNSLEKISEHSTSFTAGASLILSLGVRPLSIKSTPNVEKENKLYAMSNSIASGLIKFGLVEAVAIPVENAIKNIDKNKSKFLNSKTIENLSPRSYKLLTQMIKLSVGFLTAIPKSMITIALIPIVMDKIFKIKPENKTEKQKEQFHSISFESFGSSEKSYKIAFKGRGQDFISKQLSKIINNKSVQNFVKKHEGNDKDIAKHITAGTDILLTSAFVVNTNKSNEIKENRKKALIYNNIISTFITLVGGYSVDAALSNQSAKIADKIKKFNSNDAKVAKYIEGLNILRPALIFAGIYYCILPMFSTYLAERVDKFVNNNNNNNV